MFHQPKIIIVVNEQLQYQIICGVLQGNDQT